jgi:hypothetical protein
MSEYTEIKNLENDLDQVDLFILDSSVKSRFEMFKCECEVDENQIVEIVNRIIMLFYISPIRSNRLYIEEIIQKGDFVPIEYRLLLSDALIDKKVTSGIELMDTLIDIEEFKTLPSNIQLKYLLFLIQHKEHRKETLLFFLANSDADEHWRVKTILQTNIDIELKHKICYHFIQEPKNEVRHKIVVSQALLKNRIKVTRNDPFIVSYAEEYLLKTMKNVENDDNIRADAADTLSLYGRLSLQDEAKECLNHLGGSKRTIYQNAQNVHDDKITQSVENALKYLQSKISISELPSFSLIQQTLNELSSEEDSQSIKLALERIDIDQVTRANETTLKGALRYVYFTIINHKNKDELLKRLLEELKEMSGTCSSGYFTRLINVLQGFNDDKELVLQIGWQDQITASLTARMNIKIANHINKDDIAEELVDMGLHRKAYNKFIIESIPSVREELYQEYREYLTDDTWEQYMKNAIVFFLYAHKMI